MESIKEIKNSIEEIRNYFKEEDIYFIGLKIPMYIKKRLEEKAKESDESIDEYVLRLFTWNIQHKRTPREEARNEIFELEQKLTKRKDAFKYHFETDI